MTFDKEGKRILRPRQGEPVGRSADAQARRDRWGSPDESPWARRRHIAILVVMACAAVFYGLKFMGLWPTDECALAQQAQVKYERALADHDAVASRLAFVTMRVHSLRCDR